MVSKQENDTDVIKNLHLFNCHMCEKHLVKIVKAIVENYYRMC